MCKLQVVYVGGVSSLCYRYDVVYRRAEGVGVFQIEVHRLATNSAHCLCSVDPLPIPFKLGPVSYSLVGSFFCHSISNAKNQAKYDLVPAVNSIKMQKGVNSSRTIRIRIELMMCLSDHNADRFKSAGGDLVSGCLPTFDNIII